MSYDLSKYKHIRCYISLRHFTWKKLNLYVSQNIICTDEIVSRLIAVFRVILTILVCILLIITWRSFSLTSFPLPEVRSVYLINQNSTETSKNVEITTESDSPKWNRVVCRSRRFLVIFDITKYREGNAAYRLLWSKHHVVLRCVVTWRDTTRGVGTRHCDARIEGK